MSIDRTSDRVQVELHQPVYKRDVSLPVSDAPLSPSLSSPSLLSKMTSRPDSAAQEIIGLLNFQAAAYFRQQCCLVSVTAVVTYDWVVTLSREIHLFWTGKARPLSAILYFSNKYLNVLSYIMGILSMAPMSDKDRHCVSLNLVFIIHPTSSIHGVAGICVDSTSLAIGTRFSSFNLSVCHRYGGRTRVSGRRLSLPYVGVYRYHRHFSFSLSNSTGLVVNRVSTLLADIILMAITWKLLPASGIIKDQARSGATKMKDLSSIMLHDGIIYFVVLSMLNILQLILTVGLSVEWAGLGVLNAISYFPAPLSSVLVSHFLLDLQEAHQRTVVRLNTNDPLHTSQSFNTSSVNFANALGSLGANIDPAYYDQEEDDDSEGADDRLAATSGTPPNEGEPSQESRIEVEIAITEIPRGGHGEVATGI
ncbi:hypothetical protein LXA43DRAFT_421636 [Ganoderma leucocontextum]|nr:hypothetical protein LXA43DRAFT_421636 [Ganoderma leucocontextum]